LNTGPHIATEKSTFPLPADMRSEIIDHARAEAPRECCGVIAGKDGQPVRLYRAHNIAEGNRFYEIDPMQLIDLEFNELPSRGTEIIAIYHSHPESPPRPSATDIALAFWPDAVYLICSLENPERPEIRGWHMRDGAVTEVTLPGD
jgi:proteasome lid subunit RPN8/RPN11